MKIPHALRKSTSRPPKRGTGFQPVSEDGHPACPYPSPVPNPGWKPGLPNSQDGCSPPRRLSKALLALLLLTHPAAAAPFTPGTVVIYRVGSGTGSLVNTGNPVFLDEYTPSGTLVQSIAMPTANASPNVRLVASGTAPSEGLLTRSTDGRYLSLTGYNATIPNATSLSGTAATSVSRTIGRVAWDGSAVTSTTLNDFAGGTNPRSAFTTDGTAFWAAGGAEGVRYAPLGTNTTSTQITPSLPPSLTNLRQINSFGGQLYVSSNSGPRLATVGTGLPTTSGQTLANLPGISSTNSSSPNSFFLADLNPAVAGNDTLYIADDVLGLQKFSLVSGTWVSNGTIGTDADDYRGLTATVSGTNVTLYATRKGGSTATGGGELVKLTDTAGHNAALTGTPILLATAATNTAFRGVALAPYNLPDLTVDLSAPTTGQTGTPFSYTLTARNIGNVAASGINLGFAAPTGLTVGTINGASGFTGFASGNIVNFTGGFLAPGASATITISVTAATANTYTTAAQAAFIDPSNTIPEADETNNGSTQVVSTVISSPSTPPAITSQPASQTIPSGTTASLSVAATGTAPLTYQWYQGNSGDVTTPVGTNSASYTTPALTSNASYWVKVSNSVGPAVNSATATVSINLLVNGSFEQPVVSGRLLSLFSPNSTMPGWVVSAGDIELVTPQEWISSDGNQSLDTSGVNPGTLYQDVSGLLPGATYRLGFDLAGNPVLPSDVNKRLRVTAGSNSSDFTFNVTGFSRTNMGWTPTSLTFVAQTPAQRIQFQSLNAGDRGPALDNVSLVLTDAPIVGTPPEITTQPTNQTIPNGTTATLTVAATGSPAPNYQWYQGATGVTTTPVGTNNSSFTTPSLTSATSYWVRVSNGIGTAANSNTAVVTISPQVLIDGHRTMGEPYEERSVQTATANGGVGNVLANLHVVQRLARLNVFLGGRASGGNSVLLFLDTKPGGPEFIGNTVITSGGEGFYINNLGTSPFDGMTFEDGFTPDYALRIYGLDGDAHVNLYDLRAGTRVYLGNAGTGNRSGGIVSDMRVDWRDVTTAYGQVDYGMELALNVPGLGIPGDLGDMRMMAMLVDENSLSAFNQFLAPLPDANAPGGGIRSTNFQQVGGIQTITIQVDNSDSDGDGIPNSTDTDDDNDGLPDVHETSTGVFLSASNTGTNPLLVDTDQDGYADGVEVAGTALGFITNPNIKTFSSMTVPGDYTVPVWNVEGDAGNRMTRVGTSLGAQNHWTLDFHFRTPNSPIAFKFAANGSWNDNWGAAGAPGILAPYGDDITATVQSSGIHRITLDHGTSPATYSFERVVFANSAEFLAAYGLSADPTGDFDGDGLGNADEFQINSDPKNSDTDGNGIDDFIPQPPQITTQPASQTIASGSTATLSVTATGSEPFIYQWYQGNSGDMTTPVGTNSASFTTPTLTGTASYWVNVSNAASPTGTNSNTATVTATGGLTARTYDTTYGQSYLNSIANLMAVTPSGTSTQVANIDYGDFVASFPGLTSADFFSVLWEGWFDVSKDGPGAYTFGTNSDDGSVIFLDLNDDGDFADPGEKIVDSSWPHGPLAQTGTVVLGMDSVRIAIGYYEDDGGETMAARFKKGSGIAFASQDPINGTSGHFFTARPPANPAAANLWNFGLTGNPAVINGSNIVWTLPTSTNLESLAPTFLISDGATAVPASGSPLNFTTPQTYIVTAQDGTTRSYIVTASLSVNPVLHTFDTDAQGWRVVSFSNASTGNYSLVGNYAPSHLATGGNPGGYIRSGDPDSGGFTFGAPADFVSGLTGARGATLSYDLAYVGAVNNLGHYVVLAGGGIMLVWGSPGPLTPTPAWTRVALTLAPSSQWRVGTPAGPLATSSDFQTVLANPTGLFLKGEYTSNGSDLASIDNVSLVPATAPVIFTQPASQAIPSGTTTSLTVVAVGTGPFSYQWYQGASGDTTTPVGSNSDSFTTPVLTSTTSYWVKVSNAANPTGVNSETATVTGGQPLVTTGVATAVTETTATLNGTVNPLGQTATAQFEYGLTADYGSTVDLTLSPADGITTQSLSAVVTGLELGQTYHYRLTATYSGGTVIGNDAIFTTDPSNTLNRVWVGAGNQIFPEAIWGGVLNWTTGVAANGANTIATLGNSFNNGYTCALSFAPTIGRMVYNDPANANDFIIRNNASNFLLTLDVTSGLPSFNVAQGGRTLIIEPRIGGNDGFAKNGPGRLVLASGNSTYTGPIQANGGILEIGGGVFTVNNGKAAPNHLEQAFNLGTSGRVGNGTYAGTIFIAGGAEFLYNSSADTTLNGVISGNGSLGKSGTGTLTLTNANTYAGDTTIGGGTLRPGSSSSLPATTDLVMDGGRLDLNGQNATISSLFVGGTDVMIDFGSVAGANMLVITNGASGTWTGTLQIRNFDPSVDQLIFGSSAAGIGSNATRVSFIDPVGLAPGTYAFTIGDDGTSGPVYPPAITAQPASQTIPNGTTATLTVAATGIPAPNYQWYQGATGNTTTPVGTNSPGFTTPALTATTSYWVRLSNGVGSSVNSQTATVTVLPPPAPEIVVEEPSGSPLLSGATRDFGNLLVNGNEAVMTRSFVIRNTGDAALQNIEVSVGGNQLLDFSTITAGLGTSIAAGQSASFTVTFQPIASGPRSAILSIASNDADENPFVVNLSGTGEAAPQFTLQPQASQTIIYNATTTLTADAGGFPAPTFQWYRDQSGNTLQPIPGATSKTFVTPPLTEAVQYWVRASNSRGTANSLTAFVEVEPISTNAYLTNLVTSAGLLSPSFNANSAFYTLLVPSAVSELTLTPTKSHPAAAITVNGAAVASGTPSQVIPIPFGTSPIQVVVTAQDGETVRSYLINATRTEPMIVTTNSATGVTRNAATLEGSVVPNGAATVYFEYGTSTSFGFSTAPQQVSGSGHVPITSALSNLLSGTRYHFRLVATNGVDTVQGASRFLDTLPGAPLVITGNPVNVTTAEARLVGAVDGRGADVTVYFEYGTVFPLTQTTPAKVIPAASGYEDVIEDISGLIAGEDYQVRLVAQVGSDAPIPGELRSFKAITSGTTGGTATAKPVVTTSSDVVSISTNSAEIGGTVDAKGGSTAAWVEYGTTSALGLRSEVTREVGNLETAAVVSIPINGLVSGTQYHYRVVAENSLGKEPGSIFTFQTGFLPPSVSTDGVAVLSTTSVRVFGTVRANRADATVKFRYGTSPGNLNLLIDAAPSMVGGDVNRTVSADLPNLRQGTRYYYQVEANNIGGASVGSQRSFDVAVLSGLDRRFPDFIADASRQGSLQVNLTPPATGGWRFTGEIGWRAPGSTATGLTAGDRLIQYRPAAGYLAPITETVTIVAPTGPQVISRAYSATSTPGSGRLRVTLKPDSIAFATNISSRSQWRLAGEGDNAWKDTDTEVAGLVPGVHFIESKPVAAYETPAPVGVVIGDLQTTLSTVTYYLAANPVGAVPVPIPFATVAGDTTQPFGFIGQIFSDAGASTGFVVKPRVAATAGHVVFDDGTLAAATNLNWLFQREVGVHEPVSVPPRGFYLLSGYAAQRALDNTPGVSTPASQNLDAAALYFTDNAVSRNGYSGYLASDLEQNEFLLSDREKTLAGYPVERVEESAIGRMHATPVANVLFESSYLRTYRSTGVRGSGGMSGGPLCVREPSGIWFPSAIYLGGTSQTIVRAIDSDVADLFGFAEASAEAVEDSTGGSGVIGAATPLSTPDLGGIRVRIEPAAARNAGAGWRINSGDPYQQSSTQIVNLSPNTYTVRFPTVPGFLPPPSQSVIVSGGQLSQLTFTYEELILPPVITSPSSVTLVRGQNLFYQITTQPAADDFTLFGALPPGVEFSAELGRITGIPQAAGLYLLQAGASNEGGSGSKAITLNVLPVIASQTVNATKDSPLSHPLISGETGTGLSWAASGLPDGLQLNANTGLVSGSPLVAGVFTANISLTRNGATASAPATFTILGAAPVFTLQPLATQTIEYGTSTTLVVAATAEPAPTYQWYRGVSGNIASPVSGATSPTFVTPVLVEPTSYWVRATSIGRTADSQAASITLSASANAELASLETDAGLPSPSFNPAVTSYRITVPNNTTSIRVLPTARVSQTTIRVDDAPVTSGTFTNLVPVPLGTSRIEVKTTSGNGNTTRTYTLDVTRLPSPTAATDPATLVGDFTARLNGRVNPNGTGEAFFEYGTTSAYGSRTERRTRAGNQPVSFDADIFGLIPQTTYHFRQVLDVSGQIYLGENRQFTTSRRPPTVATGSVFNSTTTSATLTGAVNPNGQNVTLFFKHGLSPQPGNSTPVFTPNPNGGTTAVDVSQILSGLQPGNTVYYQLVAKDESNVEWPGLVESFTAVNSTGTADGIADNPPYDVTSLAATDLTTTSATLAGTANPNDGSTEVWFEYGLAGQPYTWTTPAQLIGNGNQTRPSTQRISGLTPESIYHFRVAARNSKGTTFGNDTTFNTRSNPPLVTIGTVSPISPTSVRVTGMVDPKGAATTVDFRFRELGLSTVLGMEASEGDQSGSGPRSVSAVLTDLKASKTYEIWVDASNDAGLSNILSQTLTFQPGALAGLLQQVPETTSAANRSGQLLVHLLPEGTGAWRFSGETSWRSSGIPATGLTTGNRLIEFRPESGYNRPPAESVSIISGASAVTIERIYYPSPVSGLAAITVNLEPFTIANPALPLSSRAQWRFAGIANDPWKESGTTVSELPEGNHLIECKSISGRQTPLSRSVVLADDENRSLTFTYFEATSPLFNPPGPISFETATANPALTHGYVGQVRGDLGTSTGFAVKRRVVATAAQAVFDEATLSVTGKIEWLWLPDSANHEPKPIPARGIYVFDGYAAQRAAEATPGTLTSVSQNLNVAALYFSEDAARGGASGFLASDETANPYLVSSRPKTLAGYPSVGVSSTNLGRLHVLAPSTATFTHVTGRTFDSATIRGLGGMAGGPLSVQPENGASYYPVGIYVGGTTRGIVRAIDTPVIDLFSRAEVSGNGGDNDTGGGITHSSFAALDSSNAVGAVTVTILPAAARDAGAGWRLSGMDSFRSSGFLKGNLSPGSYSLYLSKDILNYPDPPVATIKVKSDQRTEVIFDYRDINAPPSITTLAARTINEDSTTGAIDFTIGDANTPENELVLTKSSSNTALVPNANIILGGSGVNRTIAVTPAANQSGTATITVAVSDGTLNASRSFVLTVLPVNDPPILSVIPNQNLSLGFSTGPLAFIISDVETSASLLSVSASSSNTALVPPSAITLGGTAGNRTIAIVPTAGIVGSTTITLTVSDGVATTNRSFVVTVGGTALDSWRFANFGSALNAGNAADNADKDGDGQNNRSEYAAGTDPNNPADVFRVTSSTKTAGAFSLTIPGKAGRTYTLQRGPSPSGPWTDITTTGPLATAATLELTDPSPTPGSGFYRVAVEGS
jgi:choice-of-anchor C domain-containing protein